MEDKLNLITILKSKKIPFGYYVYYEKGHIKYLHISHRPKISPFFILLLLFLLPNIILLPRPQKVEPIQNNSSYKALIKDNSDMFTDEEEEKLTGILSEIQKKTGIPIVVETQNYKESFLELLNKTGDMSLIATTRYHLDYSDEDHWLMVFLVSDEDSHDWYLQYAQGDNTKGILTSSVTEKFMDSLHNELVRTDYNVGETLCASFSVLNNMKLTGYTDTSYVLSYIIILTPVYFAAVFVCFKCIKTLLIEYMYNRNKLVRIRRDLVKNETCCPVCHGSYVTGIHKNCPHCGAPVEKPAEYLSDHPEKKNLTAVSAVFDNIGGYGGDQCDIDKQSGQKFLFMNFAYNKELYDAARTYPQYKDYEDFEISSLFRMITEEGCGYVAAVNAIFVFFEGNADKFQRIFGFPMFDTDGDYNFNRLLLDFHANTDNKYFLDYQDGIEALIIITYFDYDKRRRAFKDRYGLDLFEDRKGSAINLRAAQAVLDQYEEQDVVTNIPDRGVTFFSLANRMKYYLDTHGISSTIERKIHISAAEIVEQLNNGKIIILSAGGFLIYFTERDITKKAPAHGGTMSGHAMTLTGVTDNGNYIVSSWGEKYYLCPSEISRARFLIVDIKP